MNIFNFIWNKKVQLIYPRFRRKLKILESLDLGGGRVFPICSGTTKSAVLLWLVPLRRRLAGHDLTHCASWWSQSFTWQWRNISDSPSSELYRETYPKKTNGLMLCMKKYWKFQSDFYPFLKINESIESRASFETWFSNIWR